MVIVFPAKETGTEAAVGFDVGLGETAGVNAGFDVGVGETFGVNAGFDVGEAVRVGVGVALGAQANSNTRTRQSKLDNSHNPFFIDIPPG